MMVFRTTQTGTTLVGFIVGLVIGLGIAAAVALFITKAPIPFINKVGHAPEQPVLESGKLPDPNKPLYSKETAQTSAPSEQATNPNATNSLEKPGETTRGPSASVPIIEKSRSDFTEDHSSYVQAGAYTSADAAENMRGKLALLGFEATVSRSQRDGNTVYRVRLGPYTKIDDLNRVRQRLTENGIDAGIVSGSPSTP